MSYRKKHICHIPKPRSKRKNRNGRNLKSFESTGQTPEVNFKGTEMENDNAKFSKKICLIAIIIGAIFVFKGIKDSSFNISLGKLTINCSLIGVAIIIISLLIICVTKPKVKIS